MVSNMKAQWKRVKLGDVASINAPMVNPQDERYSMLPHIGNESIEKFSGHLLNYNRVLDDQLISGKYYFTDKDVLYGKINPQLSKVAFPQFCGLCSADMYPISCSSQIIPDYLKYVLLSRQFFKYTVSLSQRSGMPKVNRNEIYDYGFFLPDIDEQTAIAKHLAEFDQEIMYLRDLRKKQTDFKRACLDQLLPKSDRSIPLVRMKGFSGEWKKCQLGDIAVEVTRKADIYSEAPVMMISASAGFIEQSEKYSDDHAGSSLKNYTLLKKGELAYNHGYSKTRNYGSCFDLRIEEARIPFVYHAFSVPNDDSIFYGYYLNSGIFDSALKKMVSSTARMDGLLNISFEDYMSLQICRPSKEEQEAIGGFFAEIDHLIDLYDRQIVKYSAIKNKLLSELLTGKVRLM